MLTHWRRLTLWILIAGWPVVVPAQQPVTLHGAVQFADENIRRIGEMAELFMEAGVIVLTAFISPYRADRQRVRGMVEHGNFIEIYCDASIEVCEARDVKGMYKKARSGQIAEFTGISSPHEIPESPDLTVDTGRLELDDCVQRVIGVNWSGVG